MKILPRWVTLLVAMVQLALMGTTSFAQLSPANGYLGKIGTNDILVSVARRDLVAVYFFDRTLGRLEFATAALDSQGRATVAANTGRIVTLAVSPDFTTGSIGGIPFVAAVEKPYGPRAAESHAYSGTGIDLTSNSNTRCCYSACLRVAKLSSSRATPPAAWAALAPSPPAASSPSP